MFPREDVYEGNCNAHSEVEYEKAAVLYNVGAIHSYLGSSDNRSTADGGLYDRFSLNYYY